MPPTNRVSCYFAGVPSPATLREALRQFLSAHRWVADAADADEVTRENAVAAEIAAHGRLHALVVAAAGPVPSAVQIDGTLIVAGLDEYGEVPESPILAVVDAAQIVAV